MKKTVFAFALAVLALAFAACGSKQTKVQEIKALTVDEVLASTDSLIDSVVTIEGVCSHTCAHGATKMFLKGNDENTLLRIEADTLGSFDPSCVNHFVSVTGVLREDRIDEEYLAEWATELLQKHGDTVSGCATENAAHGLQDTDESDQIAQLRERIAARDSIEGKPYLSFYYVQACSYKIKEGN